MDPDLALLESLSASFPLELEPMELLDRWMAQEEYARWMAVEPKWQPLEWVCLRLALV